jgi:hypothetical protein
MHKVRDRMIIQWYHRLELIFLLVSLIVIATVRSDTKWYFIYSGTAAIALGIVLYRYYIFRRLNKNLLEVLEIVQGTFEPGNFFWMIPPQIRFMFKGTDCHIRSIIDSRFRLVMEYSCQFAKEWEFRLDKRHEKGVKKHFISGANKDLYRRILKDPEARGHLKRLLKDFDHLYYGKDGMFRAEIIFDSYLTDKVLVLSHLERMRFLGKFLKLDEE